MAKNERNASLHKILFIGPTGAGKTTAITAISDTPPITTEAANTGADKQTTKSTTTVAMDYGSIELEHDVVHLYGIPGQKRFRFMWPILARGAFGCVVLIDESRDDPLQDLDDYIKAFDDLIRRQSFVVGVVKTPKDGMAIEKYSAFFANLGMFPPIFESDVREKADVLMMLEILLINQEIN